MGDGVGDGPGVAVGEGVGVVGFGVGVDVGMAGMDTVRIPEPGFVVVGEVGWVGDCSVIVWQPMSRKAAADIP